MSSDTDQNTVNVFVVTCPDGVLNISARTVDKKLQSKLIKISHNYTNSIDIMATVMKMKDFLQHLAVPIADQKSSSLCDTNIIKGGHDNDNQDVEDECNANKLYISECSINDDDTIDITNDIYLLSSKTKKGNADCNDSSKNNVKVEIGDDNNINIVDIFKLAMAEFTKTDEKQVTDSCEKKKITQLQTQRRVGTPKRLRGKEENGVVDGKATEYPIKCTYCSKMFVEQFFLVRHVKTVHSEAPRDSRPFMCSSCGHSFRMMHYLGQHLMTHNADTERPYKCDGHCNQTFNTKRQLDQHIMKYKNMRPHRCVVCHKAWPTIAGLRDHMTVHKGQKPFLCYDCGAAFKRNSQLKNHLVQHVGQKYHCDQCGKQFANVAYFTKHMTIHNPNRVRFPCPYCDMTLSRKSHVTKHVQKIHAAVSSEGRSQVIAEKQYIELKNVTAI